MIILASQSPRRREILEKITPDFIVCPSDGDEHIPAAEPPAFVQALALRKARQAVVKGHLEGCVQEAMESGTPEERAEKLDEIIRLMEKMEK